MPRPVADGSTTTMLTATDETSLALHDLGGRGEIAFFTHAAGFHGRIWVPVAQRLADRLRSVALDLRGHGDSGPCVAPRNYLQFGTDLITTAQAFEAPPLGIGHSLGGAALLAAELAHPGTFAELILFEPAVSDPALMVPGTQALFAGAARRRRTTFASYAEARDNFAAKPPTSTFSDDVLDSYTTHGFRWNSSRMVQIKCDPATEAAIYEADGPRDLWQRMRPISTRTTLVRGAESQIWNHRTAESVADRIGAAVEILPDAGHFGPLEDPGVFAGLIRTILDRSGRRSTQ